MLSARTRVTEPEQKMSHHRTGPTHERRERCWAALGWGAAVRSRDPCGSPRHALTGAGRPASLARGGPAGQHVLNLPPFPLPTSFGHHHRRPPRQGLHAHQLQPPPTLDVPVQPKAKQASPGPQPAPHVQEVGIPFTPPLPWGRGPPPAPQQGQAQHCVRGSREVQYG